VPSEVTTKQPSAAAIPSSSPVIGKIDTLIYPEVTEDEVETLRSELFLKFPMELEPISLFQCWLQSRHVNRETLLIWCLST
jgi:hypothetical protein